MRDTSNSTRCTQTIKVWDPFVRVFHWSLVVCFFGAYLLGENNAYWHQILGYATSGLIGLRIVWGFVGSTYARFSNFVPTLPTVVNYIKDIKAKREMRSIGHNPLGALMIISLILAIITLGITGWMMSLDQFFGVEWVEETHETVANLTLILVGLHIAGVIFSSKRHEENLVKSMITGLKKK